MRHKTAMILKRYSTIMKKNEKEVKKTYNNMSWQEKTKFKKEHGNIKINKNKQKERTIDFTTTNKENNNG